MITCDRHSCRDDVEETYCPKHLEEIKEDIRNEMNEIMDKKTEEAYEKGIKDSECTEHKALKELRK